MAEDKKMVDVDKKLLDVDLGEAVEDVDKDKKFWICMWRRQRGGGSAAGLSSLLSCQHLGSGKDEDGALGQHSLSD